MMCIRAIKGPLQLLVIVALLYVLLPSGMTAEKMQSEGHLSDSGRVSSIKADHEDANLYPVPPPLVYQSLYPCQACHQSDIRGVNSRLEQGNAFLGTYIRLPDPEPRILVRMHRNIRIDHAEWMWCLNCHSTDERNYLKLITGEEISFEKSYRLCGQCHGSIFRDWRIGIHGRRVGKWHADDRKLYLLCTHCHDPHQPRFRKLPGMQAPEKPSYGRWEAVEAHE